MVNRVPESLVKAKYRLENHHEDLNISVNNENLIIKRKDNGKNVDHLEINGNNGKWNWTRERRLSAGKKDGKLDSLEDPHEIEILVENHLIPSNRDTIHRL